ncbi:uncharacterized protein LOC130810797 [Amaranthus tricolor]|uniref:uncharacterized protein LOC130810797 n=1 Tax=Amaranthus tricolor TaxID=29722 RepID=UPI002582B9C0|nr:uncharacterized protein LOC130810797 [Amaranthus tricolor]
MKAAQDRKKSYADLRRRPDEYEVCDKVLLHVSPMNGVVRFGARGKLSPRFNDPEPLELDKSLTYEEQPVQILDRKVRSTLRKDVAMVKRNRNLITIFTQNDWALLSDYTTTLTFR